MKQDLFTNVSPEPKRGSPIRDSTMETVYPSRNATYRALAPGFGLDPKNPYGWYKLCDMFPMRFVDVKTHRRIDANGSCVERSCKLCGRTLPNYRKRPYQDCATCEARVLQKAMRLHRPVVYNDFLKFRPKGEGTGYWEEIIKGILERHGYLEHLLDETEPWTCNFPKRWAPRFGMRTHFHSPIPPTR